MKTSVRVAAVLLLAAGSTAAQATPGHAVTTTKTQIQYILSPHPDDVFQAWGLIQDSSANYPVFITLTKGESTGHCTGTRTIDGVAYDLTQPSQCKAARMASLNGWLDDQSDADAYLDDYRRAGNADMVHYQLTAAGGGTDTTGAPTVAGMTACKPVYSSGGCSGTSSSRNTPIPDNLNQSDGATAARVVDWWVGPTSARIEFDLGDGNLTDAEVVWAVNHVRANRAALLPLSAEYGVIGAGYLDLQHEYPACYEYDHHDHRAVQEAVYSTDLLPVSGYHPQWGVTCGSQTTTAGVDPDALAVNGGRANKISDGHYSQNMTSSPASFQNRFGWLSDPGPTWAYGGDPAGNVLFSQWNYFWRRFS
ncbi:hypothetical protein [Hamadaea tsunoensis]|uniref:hypothetical protein n=1 Tax=Hamadaea tsunoensis TaxID=53368 RepID=UPI0004185279|nr:hypothetical protein [Hamadaea tsunoensis]